MAVTLLALSGGHYSLEFATSDIPAVSRAIKDLYGNFDQDQHIVFVEYRFGGCVFHFQNDYDDPCLISDTTEGDEILKSLHAKLTATS